MTNTGLIHTRKVDQLHVRVYDNRESMGRAAGEAVASRMRDLLAAKPNIRMIFAAAPSQNEALEALAHADGIDWSRVTAFHMDEYIGLPADAPQRFSRYLSERLFDRVKPGQVHLIDCASPVDAECARYGGLIREAPIDIVCLGIGENGHIAFNDPPVADFADPAVIKPVELDDACRWQQVHDGCFAAFDEVPTHALTLTIPALMSGARLICIVPGPTKHEAVQHTLNDAISEQCPASVMRRHGNCTLFVDADAYGGITS